MPRTSSGRGGVHFFVINGMRLILLVALLFGLFEERYLILILAALGLCVTLVPMLLHRLFRIEVPGGFEVLVLLFVYGLLYLGEVKGLYEQFWIVSVLLKLFASMTLGFVGLAALYALYRQEKVQGPAFVIAFFSFCFAIAASALWELFEFGLDSTLGFSLQQGMFDTMRDLFSSALGAFIVSSVGYYYLKRGRIFFISTLVESVVEKNASRLGVKAHPDHLRMKVRELIDRGETNKVEFKSTLRTNVHTGQIDKNIEHAALKTVAGYLNAEGGTLLVGVNDTKEVKGLDADNFPSHDKLGLYFTNLVKDHIGAEFLPYINFEIVGMDDKHVLKIDCNKSPKEVFLKQGKEEHFYVRNGPSTATLTGSALVDYITNRFR